jgi:hypothetical protein
MPGRFPAEWDQRIPGPDGQLAPEDDVEQGAPGLKVHNAPEPGRRRLLTLDEDLPLTAWLNVAEDLTSEIDDDGDLVPMTSVTAPVPGVAVPTVLEGPHDLSTTPFPTGALIVMNTDPLFDQSIAKLRQMGVRELTFDERAQLRSELSQLGSRFLDYATLDSLDKVTDEATDKDAAKDAKETKDAKDVAKEVKDVQDV